MAKIKPLRSSPIFNDLSDRELALFTKVVQEETFEGDTVLVAERMRSDAFYFIDTGRVAVTVGRLGADQEPLILGPGETFGEWALLVPGHLTAVTVRCLVRSNLLMVRASDFERFSREEPAVALKVVTILLRLVWKSVGDVKEAILSTL